MPPRIVLKARRCCRNAPISAFLRNDGLHRHEIFNALETKSQGEAAYVFSVTRFVAPTGSRLYRGLAIRRQTEHFGCRWLFTTAPNAIWRYAKHIRSGSFALLKMRGHIFPCCVEDGHL
jgi:hypothetical protein